MVQLIKSLPSKGEALSAVLQNLHKNWASVALTLGVGVRKSQVPAVH